jgi:hypothetical protein
MGLSSGRREEIKKNPLTEAALRSRIVIEPQQGQEILSMGLLEPEQIVRL